MKVFRRLRMKFLKEGKARRYLLYATGEVFLVMIGILLALQVDSWNDDRLRRKEEVNYYRNVREQLVDDSTNIYGNWRYNKQYMAEFEYAIDIIERNDRAEIDSLGKIMLNLTQYSDVDRQGNLHETLVMGGQLKILRNQEIINSIRDLERRYIYMNRMENIHWDVIMQDALPAISDHLKFHDSKVKEPDSVYSYKFQNLILGLSTIMVEKATVYEETNESIRLLLEVIDQELSER